MSEMPPVSRETWKAAQIAAERAIPVLIAKGLHYHAAQLAERTKVFAERAG